MSTSEPGMLNTTHPDDERLSALADGDTDATADAPLTAHVRDCDRCSPVVRELGILRAALAELPDVAPHRPLRLVPAVEADAPGAADRLGLWARRLFAPALTLGAVVAMVGVVGTALPAFSGMAQSGGADAGDAAVEMAAETLAAPAGGEGDTFLGPASSGAGGGGEGPESEVGTAQTEDDERTARASDDLSDYSGGRDALAAERSPWPMVLFAGLAVMIAAGLARWIFAARVEG